MTYAISLPERGQFAAWREAARLAISHRIAPADLDWSGGGGLFAGQSLPQQLGPHQAKVPAAFVKFAKSVHWHSDPARFALLYQALWNLDTGAGDPMSSADPLGRRLALLVKAVRRDIHKMHAFVRFRELPNQSAKRRRFAAWFEPDHYTLEPGSAFFAKRFADMDWLIATPYLTARFEDGVLQFDPGVARPNLPDDATEALWGTYFANIFNPARVKLQAMRGEMPKKYWKNLPETALIPSMLQDAEARVSRMHAAAATVPRLGAAAISTRYRAAMPVAPELPETLDEARQAAMLCQRCGLCEAATQTVWGEGALDAKMMVVGEQPGDREDLTGRPFIGPAGEVLRKSLRAAKIPADQTWLTNAVKHFKFKPRGKLRLHQNPEQSEIIQCRWWLGLELGFIAPKVVVALGATAAFALTGNDAPLAARRGALETGLHGGAVLISWHPAYILRLPDPEARAIAQRELEQDLRKAWQMCSPA